MNGLKGFVLAGSALINESVFVLASWSKLSDEIGISGTSVDVDFTQYQIGAGYRYALTDSTDAYASVSFAGIDVAAEAFGESESEDETGYAISAGIRSMLTAQFELGGSIAYVDIADESETSISATASYHFTDQFALSLSLSAADDTTTSVLSAQYKW